MIDNSNNTINKTKPITNNVLCVLHSYLEKNK